MDANHNYACRMYIEDRELCAVTQVACPQRWKDNPNLCNLKLYWDRVLDSKDEEEGKLEQELKQERNL